MGGWSSIPPVDPPAPREVALTLLVAVCLLAPTVTLIARCWTSWTYSLVAGHVATLVLLAGYASTAEPDLKQVQSRFLDFLSGPSTERLTVVLVAVAVAWVAPFGLASVLVARSRHRRASREQ
jgi:type IV secretory pathway TrbD component